MYFDRTKNFLLHEICLTIKSTSTRATSAFDIIRYQRDCEMVKWLPFISSLQTCLLLGPKDTRTDNAIDKTIYYGTRLQIVHRLGVTRPRIKPKDLAANQDASRGTPHLLLLAACGTSSDLQRYAPDYKLGISSFHRKPTSIPTIRSDCRYFLSPNVADYDRTFPFPFRRFGQGIRCYRKVK